MPKRLAFLQSLRQYVELLPATGECCGTFKIAGACFLWFKIPNALADRLDDGFWHFSNPLILEKTLKCV